MFELEFTDNLVKTDFGVVRVAIAGAVFRRFALLLRGFFRAEIFSGRIFVAVVLKLG
jgi:hypothetical protein